MLDKLINFHSHAKKKIRILISAYYMFCKQSDILNYIIKLLEKDRFFYNNIKNISNQRYYYRSFHAYGLINYI